MYRHCDGFSRRSNSQRSWMTSKIGCGFLLKKVMPLAVTSRWFWSDTAMDVCSPFGCCSALALLGNRSTSSLSLAWMVLTTAALLAFECSFLVRQTDGFWMYWPMTSSFFMSPQYIMHIFFVSTSTEYFLYSNIYSCNANSVARNCSNNFQQDSNLRLLCES